ncbi:hypothetical protein [Pseudooctadecabacter jejudonensis]|uniref:Lipoprotein n=1 Tax=Pseudooctadecabacter jejudonensis TaxID=1391910 RepID=A0A1Y5RBI7_9RHOB|nr:hypothetical protein [Pseudooctadecabacter jejudonensis]SLN10840.1 hypothetical protein PSJ8397_00054 [Pseudooctadecabacter jejudonensis]
MIRATLLGTAVMLTVTGCARVAESRFNPLNWFGPSESAPVQAVTSDVRPLVPEGRQTIVIDNRSLVQSVTSLSVDRTTTGAIVRATGVAPTVGFYNAELVPTGVDGGVLTLAFRAQAPEGFSADGSARARQISAAYVMDMSELAAVRSVRVQAASNARVARR